MTKEKGVHWTLREEALDCNLWRTGFGRVYEPAARQTAECEW